MVKKNIAGIIMVVCIAVAFVIGYQMGRSSSGGNGSSKGGPPFGPPKGSPPSGVVSGKSPSGGKITQSGMPSSPSSGMVSGKAPNSGAPSAGMPSGKSPFGGKKGKVQSAVTADSGMSSKNSSKPSFKEEPATPAQTFYGTVIPLDEARVQSEQGGTIIFMKSKEGDAVKKGEVLVRFDNSDKLLELEKQESSRVSLQQKVEQAVSNYNTVKKDYERNKNLF